MTKIKKLTSFEKLSPEALEAVNERYPDGWKNHIFKVDKGNGDYFYAITVEDDKFSYLVKVDVKIDSLSELEKEEEKDDFDEVKDDDMKDEMEEEY